MTKLITFEKKALISFVTLVFIVSSNLLSDEIKCLWDEECSSINWPILIVFLIAYFFAAFCAFRLGKSLFRVNLNYQKETKPKSAMIAFVSKMPKIEKIDERKWTITNNGKIYELCCDLDQDIEILEGSNLSFQQLLRAIKPHKEKLRKIVLLYSDQSRVAAEDYLAILPAYLPNISIDSQLSDFENLEKLLDVLRKSIRRLNSQNYNYSDIVLDVTGGLKTASIAAAMMTLHYEDLVFQYVSTNQPYNVLTFNTTGEHEELNA